MRIDDKIHGQSVIVSIREDKILQIDIYSNGEYPIWTLLQHLRSQIIGINNRLNIVADDYIIKNKNNQTASFPVESVLKAKQRGRIEMDSSDGGEFETYYISEILDDSFGNENIELYMEKVKSNKEKVSVDRLADIARHTNIYYQCFFDNSRGFTEDHVSKLVQEMLRHEETITAEVIDTLMNVLSTYEDSVVNDITEKVKHSKTKMNKLDCLQKLTAIGSNAIKIGEALNSTWANIQADIPDVWSIIAQAINNC